MKPPCPTLHTGHRRWFQKQGGLEHDSVWEGRALPRHRPQSRVSEVASQALGLFLPLPWLPLPLPSLSTPRGTPLLTPRPRPGRLRAEGPVRPAGRYPSPDRALGLGRKGAPSLHPKSLLRRSQGFRSLGGHIKALCERQLRVWWARGLERREPVPRGALTHDKGTCTQRPHSWGGSRVWPLATGGASGH